MKTHDSSHASKPAISMSPAEFASLGGGHFGYIRRIDIETASSLIGEPISISKDDELFCLYQADGTPILISPSRTHARAQALENDLLPMSVH